MKFYYVVIGALLSCLLMNCHTINKTSKSMIAANPLLTASPLQYQAPVFDKIKNEHFKPAIEAAMVEQMANITTITNNTAAPTFENTIVALEKSGLMLNRVYSIFSNFTSANTNDDIQKIEQEIAPKLAAHSDAIYLNDKLFQRVKAVNSQLSSLTLDEEDKKLVDYYFKKFEKAGANLSISDKEKLKKLNEEEASLITSYTSKLLAARKAGGLLITDKALLDGLNKEELDAAAQNAKLAGKEGYLLALQNTTQQPLLQDLKNRSIREQLFKASWTRAEKGDQNDTRPVIEKLALLRMQKAKLLGYDNYAAWTLQDQMAKTPAAARTLLEKLAAPSVARAKIEAAEIQALINTQGGGFTLEPWDWNFYAEQVRKAKYDLDESQIKPYFDVRTVLEKGVFYAAEKLYGVTFKPRTDLPVYHPDVVAYEVYDRDGKSIAIYYLDFYSRDNKAGGAWMSNYVEQSHLLGQKPVIVNVFNYQKPAPGRPSLISYDDVSTMFHEFGHSIHGLFANQKYISLSGTNVPRDFVEFPSQINEHWALESSILKNYAIHYETRQPIPQELVTKIKKAATFNQGYAMTEVVAAAMLDLEWHSIGSEAQLKPANDFETTVLQGTGLLMNQVPTRYHSPYFLHIWGNGYSAGYYAYLWSETLDHSAYDWFMNHGGMTRANGDRYRDYILSVGNARDLNTQFKNFIGHQPDINAMLRNRGLIE